jgi:cyclophilin family peptidyl-prolyl cis-trans isomerase
MYHLKIDQLNKKASTLFLVLALCSPVTMLDAMTVRMQTDLGGIDILLRDDVAPNNVANFLEYANSGAYDGTFIHRNVPGFVVQGGGFKFNPDDGPFFGGGASHIPELPTVDNEFNLSNVRATLAAAKKAQDFYEEGDDIPAGSEVGDPIPGTGPDSATSEWFFNLADNSGFPNELDTQNGGFTVFGEVTDRGMQVVDLIAEQDVCFDIPQLGPFFCPPGSLYSDTIQINASQSTGFDTDTLLLINFVGADGDGDGVIDRVEDAAPNGGNSNGDADPDSTQTHVASFAASNGDYVTVEAPAGTRLEPLDVFGGIYALVNAPASFCELNGLDFNHNYFGFDLQGVTGSADVTVTLPVGESPDDYYNFGPTPDNPVPHWYRFVFDPGAGTGAEFADNVITLHFVDGERGDSNLGAADGVIVTAGGSALSGVFVDEDGVSDAIEDAAPNGGDGNDDLTMDSLQGHVVSFTDLHGDYVTVETNSAGSLTGAPVKLLNGNAPLPAVGSAAVLTGHNLAHGFFSFEMCAETGTATVILPEGEKPSSYFMFGPTPNNPEPHYYEFRFDPATGTGAVINGNVITLHFVDGERGDSDLDGTNGVISDPGGPAFPSLNIGGGGGGSSGGCTLTGSYGSGPEQAGAWWLLLTLISLAGMWRIRRGVAR